MNWGLLSKYRDELYGISIIWIILFHGLEIKRTALPKFLRFIDPILDHGNCGVEIFLFLSGICLFFSLEGNYDILAFLKKRIKRIILPFLLIDGVYWFYSCIYLKGDFSQFIQNITFYSFWIGKVKTVWFIALILLLYLIYPIIYRVVVKNKHASYIIALVVAFFYLLCFALKCFFPSWFSGVEVALTRIPVFLIGCFVGKLVFAKLSVNITTRILTFIFLIYGVGYFYQQPYSLVKSFRIPYLFIGPSIAIWLCIVLDAIDSNRLNRFFCAWGEISLELYLMHIVFRRLYVGSSFYTNRVYMNYLVYFIFCFCVCFALCKIVYLIENKIWHFVDKRE